MGPLSDSARDYWKKNWERVKEEFWNDFKLGQRFLGDERGIVVVDEFSGEIVATTFVSLNWGIASCSSDLLLEALREAEELTAPYSPTKFVIVSDFSLSVKVSGLNALPEDVTYLCMAGKRFITETPEGAMKERIERNRELMKPPRYEPVDEEWQIMRSFREGNGDLFGF